MNKVDYLLEHPFHTLSNQDKLNVKILGPDQPNISITQKHKTQSRSFNTDWYQRTHWLTASESKQTLFCFNCLVFGGDAAWTLNGVKDLKHLSERIKSHEQTFCHIANSLKLSLFIKVNVGTQLDEGYKISIQHHNELVDKNRHILKRIIDCLKFCGRCELAFRGHDESEESPNRSMFLDLVNEIAKLDSQLYEHLQYTTVSNHTSITIQNELLDSIYDVYRDALQENVNEAMFVSVQVDETTHISNKSQLVIILRFVRGTKVVEKFHGFIEIKDRSAAGISNCILEELRSYSLKDKLISQSYDGAVVMSGACNGIHQLIRDAYPHAYFLHCYAHQLNVVMQNVCSTITPIRIFFANLSAFSSFFSTSSKRIGLLQEVCKHHLPLATVTRWNFQSRAVNTVYQNKGPLMECFEKIQQESGWDSVSIREASSLIKFLEDEEFLFFLEFFSEIMAVIEVFYNILQKKMTTPTSVKEHLHTFTTSIFEIQHKMSESSVDSEMSTGFKRKRKRKSNIVACAIECCDIILNQAEDRFGATEHLECFSLVDPAKFVQLEPKFPMNICSCSKFYPFVTDEKLRSELRVLYSSEELKDIKSVHTLYSFLTENNLQCTFSETVKMLNIALTSPIVTAESERCFSTLKRVKTCLRNTMGQDRLNALSVLSIEKEFIAEIQNFNTKVIQKFAEQNRRAPFLYQ